MKRLLIDCDGILANFALGVCKALKAAGHGHRYPDEFTDPQMKRVMTPSEQRTFENLAGKQGFVRNLPRYDGAQQVLKDLRAKGHAVRCITAPWKGPYWHQERYEWLSSFGFSEDEMIFCPGREKRHHSGDVLIEDRSDTCRDWTKDHPSGLAFLVDRPWNRDGSEYDHDRILRVMHFRDVVGAL